MSPEMRELAALRQACEKLRDHLQGEAGPMAGSNCIHAQHDAVTEISAALAALSPVSPPPAEPTNQPEKVK